MNMSALFAEWLRVQGWDARRWNELGAVNDDDELIMEWCVRHDACLITQDGDFGTLLFQTGAVKPSVLRLRDCDPMDRALWERIDSLLRLERHNIEAGCLYVMNPRGTRMRHLPLHPGDLPPLPGEQSSALNSD